MNQLFAGFSRVNVTPMLGIGIYGYFKPRYADGVLDELELNALALGAGEKKIILLSLDSCEPGTKECGMFRAEISKATGIPAEAIFIHSTHTHTGPFVVADSEDALEKEYFTMLLHKMADAAVLAVADMKPARMGWAIGQAPNIAFIRRFRMKDGSVQTNPGVGNPNIDHPIGDVDERVNVLRFDREGADTVVLVNFADHPDTVGGCKISADWPGFLRKRLEKAMDDVKCVFFNGAQGDVNHVNVNAKGGELNDMFMDFDDVSRGYGHARHMGNVVAGAVMQVYDKVNYVDVEDLDYATRLIQVPSNMPKPEDMAQAYAFEELHQAGKDEEIPFEGMELTTVVAEAERMIRLEHGPASFPMELIGIRIGSIAMVGIPGEPFTGIGRGIKQAEGWMLVMPCCLTNGSEGYFPMKEAYDEGGYEARSSIFKAGVAEQIIEEGKALLNTLRA